jgi:UDP-3-O-[3-hydroxymyristoyl] N-acetylglucosamine deacetylase
VFSHPALLHFMLHQTLQKAVSLHGVTLHGGTDVTVRLVPSQAPGLVFSRTDLPGAPEIAADFRRVARTHHATVLECDGAGVSTTEHLLAALWTMGVTACRIELDGPEVPIGDGSAAPWVRLIEEAGIESLGTPRPVYRLMKPVWSGQGDVSVLGLPAPTFRLTCAVEYALENTRQCCDFQISPDVFACNIAPARTFALESWLEPLRAAGLIRGGSLESAIVLNEKGPSVPFRFDDELARHKALDVLGDLALLFAGDGGILQAHIIATRAGHGPHRAWMQAAVESGALVCEGS